MNRHLSLSLQNLATFGLLALSLSQARDASADDLLILSNGTSIAGKQVAEDPKTAITTLQFDNGIKVELPRLQVKSVIADNKDFNYYRSNANKAADTVQAHQSIINFLIKSGFKEFAYAHMQRITELDPSNKSNWRSLNYYETSIGWMPSEIYWKSKGMVKDGSRWRTPQDLAIATLLEERKRKQSEMKRKIESNIREFNTSGRRGDEARQFFVQLKDAAALPILTEKILDKGIDEATRLYLLDVVLRLDAMSLTRAVVKIYISDDSVQVREKCLDYLTEHPSDEAVYQLRQYLVNANPSTDRPETFNRAGEALSYIGDDRCIPDLIEALVTKHRYKVGPDAKYNISFGNNGPSGMTQGGPKEVEQPSRNNGVLSALNSITGADLSYDRQAWIEWYAQYKAHVNLPLRRDP